MIKKLGFQLYTVRDFMTDPDIADTAFKKLSAMGYSEVHTAGNYMSDEALGELCKKHNMTIIGSHYDYDKILNDPEATMAVHDAWGTKNVGIGGMPREIRESLAGVKGFIEEFNRAAEIYAKHGFRLTYHHHNFEFARIDGYKTIMDLLYENLDPKNTSFVLDTCWISAGGGDICAWLEKCAGRVDCCFFAFISIRCFYTCIILFVCTPSYNLFILFIFHTYFFLSYFVYLTRYN